jgi:hypothetical protein
MVVDLYKKVQELKYTPSDINEHFDAIINYGSECKHITEMGVRSIESTWGWLYTKPEHLICYDIQHPDNLGGSLQDFAETAEAIGTNFSFILANVLQVEIEPTELLFIDTWHAYKQLKAELAMHSDKVSKYIVLHDTTSFESHDEDSYLEWGDEWQPQGIGIWKAVEEFLQDNPHWSIAYRYTHNNGLTILKRG